MRDLTNPRLIQLKGILFFFAGLFAAALLLVRDPSWTTALLLSIAVWAFCRAYYFAFYVVQRYVDPTFRYSGLGSFVSHRWTRAHPAKQSSEPGSTKPH